MSLYSVDVEADGPCPGLYSMLQLGAVIVEPALDRSFSRHMRPITDNFIEGALESCNLTRAQSLTFGDPQQAMIEFRDWILATNDGGTRPTLVSDNPAFDWQFVNYYFHYYLGENPFGFSARRIGDLYCGLIKDWRAATRWKHMRKTKHTHDAKDDAMGNAEALLAMSAKYNIKI